MKLSQLAIKTVAEEGIKALQNMLFYDLVDPDDIACIGSFSRELNLSKERATLLKHYLGLISADSSFLVLNSGEIRSASDCDPRAQGQPDPGRIIELPVIATVLKTLKLSTRALRPKTPPVEQAIIDCTVSSDKLRIEFQAPTAKLLQKYLVKVWPRLVVIL